MPRSGPADFETDARVLHARARSDRLHTLDLIDATSLIAARDGIRVSAACRVADLHLSIDEADTLTLWASTPPPELRLEGERLSCVRAVTLNGREFTDEAANNIGGRLIHGGDWRPMTPGAVRLLLPSPACSCV